jgi:asparagine synthase (glutamine-hydrolysing)
MCGIAGIFGTEDLTDPKSIMARMTNALAHRGPDAQGCWEGTSVVLGHRRLSIIDLSSNGDQPFHSADGRYTIVFNGEIYNYRELRSTLTAEGVVFLTATDTEVLLQAYIFWGRSAMDRLHGMFAFAVWDAHTQQLFLARDRMGIKPLYFFQNDRQLVFASEIRALLATGLVPRRLDTDALVDHLRYQTVHSPKTLVRNVHLLPAGHWMLVSDQEIGQGRWYDLVANARTSASVLSLKEIQREVHDRLSRAVERRLVADVPFGAFLSGGIDSSAIVGLMSGMSSDPVHTFSVVFNEAEFSEERYADLVANRFRTEHTTIRLKPEDLLHALPDALAAMDHPSADGPNTYVVSKATKAAGVSMALSGLGGDEVFAGYPVFPRTLALWQRRWITQFPRSLRGAMAQFITAVRPSVVNDKFGELLRTDSFSVDDTYPVSRLAMLDRDLVRLLDRSTLPPNRVRAIMHDLIRTDKGYALPFLSQVSLGELSTYLQHVLLRDTDQMSMAHALEVRVPFLDHELVEFVLGVDDARKYPHSPKQLLVDSLGDLLPREIVDRPKMGFTLPWAIWMRGELHAFCAERLEKLGQRPQFRKGAVDVMWQRFLAEDPRTNWSRVWSLVVLGDWLERHGIEH